MNQITQHIPGFVDNGGEPKISKFKTTKDLLKVPWVKSFSKDAKFHRYSLADESLMAEYQKGKEYWVVGDIQDPTTVDLPQWVKK